MITIAFSKETITRLQEEIRIAMRLSNIRLYRLAQALLWYGEGRNINDIAADMRVTVRTIFEWIKCFMHKGLSWLTGQHYKGRGRKSKMTKAQRKELYDMIVAGPEASGFNCGIWNCAMIAELILREFQVVYSPNYLPSILKKMGLSYQKARFVSDRLDEEEYQKAREKWEKETWPAILKQAKEENAVILFGDEVSFAMWGSLSRTWGPTGQQPEVKTKGIRKGLKMYGAIELRNGDFHYRESLAYALTAKSLKLLKGDEVPEEVLTLLKTLKDEKYSTQSLFSAALKTLLDEEVVQKYQALILKHSEAAGRFNGDGYMEFLKQIHEHYDCKVILIEDGAAYHRRADVEAYKKAAPRLSVYPLPAFSPDYNPIEKLWKNTKRDATHLKYFETFEKLRESVIGAFKDYLNDASKVTCVMKKLRLALL